MNDKALKTLEFLKIRDALSQYANSQAGKKLCETLVPSSDISLINKNLDETAAAVLRISMYGTISFNGVKELHPTLRRLSLGSSLSIPELLSVSAVLTVAQRAKDYAKDSEKDKNEGTRLPGGAHESALYEESAEHSAAGSRGAGG